MWLGARNAGSATEFCTLRLNRNPDTGLAGFTFAHRVQPYSGRAKDTLKHGEVRGVGKLKAAEFVHSEPADCIVLFWLAIVHRTDPGATNPHGEVQAIVRIGLPKDGLSVDTSKMDAEFLAELSPECVGRALARFDVTAREVPDIRIPAPAG